MNHVKCQHNKRVSWYVLRTFHEQLRLPSLTSAATTNGKQASTLETLVWRTDDWVCIVAL